NRIGPLRRWLELGGPRLRGGAVDWARVDQVIVEMMVVHLGEVLSGVTDLAPDHDLFTMLRAWSRRDTRDYAAIARAWQRRGRPPVGPVQTQMVAETLVATHSDEAPKAIEALRAYYPASADVLAAVRLEKQKDLAGASVLLRKAYEEHRSSPWRYKEFFPFASPLAINIAKGLPEEVPALVSTFSRPWVLDLGEETRFETLVGLAVTGPSSCKEALAPVEARLLWKQNV